MNKDSTDTATDPWDNDPGYNNYADSHPEEVYEMLKGSGTLPESIKDKKLRRGYEAWLKVEGN